MMLWLGIMCGCAVLIGVFIAYFLASGLYFYHNTPERQYSPVPVKKYKNQRR